MADVIWLSLAGRPRDRVKLWGKTVVRTGSGDDEVQFSILCNDISIWHGRARYLLDEYADTHDLRTNRLN